MYLCTSDKLTFYAITNKITEEERKGKQHKPTGKCHYTQNFIRLVLVNCEEPKRTGGRENERARLNPTTLQHSTQNNLKTETLSSFSFFAEKNRVPFFPLHSMQPCYKLHLWLSSLCALTQFSSTDFCFSLSLSLFLSFGFFSSTFRLSQ